MHTALKQSTSIIKVVKKLTSTQRLTEWGIKETDSKKNNENFIIIVLILRYLKVKIKKYNLHFYEYFLLSDTIPYLRH